MLMAYEVTRDMPPRMIEIETPLETMTGKMIDGKKLVLVSILRAGNGILDGMLTWCRAPAWATSACTATPRR
jgi:uracil phosphoribosyltransferase